MSPSLALAVSTLLDPERLSGAVGEARTATRVRIKPGASVSASLADPSGAPAGWARVLWPAALKKADKAAARAAGLGLPTWIRPLSQDLRIQWGGVASDPALMPHIDRARASGAIDPATWRILRHNPLRRLVVRSAGTVVRIHARADRRAAALSRFLEATIPVPARLDDGSDPHVCVLADAGGSDLSSPRGTTERVREWTERAGRLFARLHTARPPAPLAASLASPAPATRAALQVHARIIGALDDGLGRRIADLARAVPEPAPAPAVPIHADASPDQVLIDEAGAVLLTDFDRARMGAAALDVASYAASAGPAMAPSFLRGYEQAGGRIPGGAHMAAAVVHARALSLAGPLREARPDWAARVAATLDLMEEGAPWH
ncbi:phosphotransferase [Schaalia georgiae]|nr:phosphotransferase [Schaalia georgiae]